jgi:hypothetical protein
MERDYRYRRTSFFFPIMLITAGIVWLLVNNGTIPVENIYRLLPFWPVLLILAGVSLMLRRLWWPINAMMWAGVAVVVVWLLTSGAAFLPTLTPLELKHETLRAPLTQTKSAVIKLDLSIHPVKVHALSDSIDLLVADVYSVNGVVLDDSGSEQKNVQLHEGFGNNNVLFNPRIDQWIEAATRSWDIGLSPAVPLALTVDAGTGQTDLNLNGLKLQTLKVSAGTGQMNIILPQSQAALPVNLNMGTGAMDVRLPSGTAVDLNVDGGTGGLVITLPEGAGVQVNVPDSGLGGLTLPSGYSKTSGDPNEKDGTWQNSAFSGAKTPITITLRMGTGGVTIR